MLPAAYPTQKLKSLNQTRQEKLHAMVGPAHLWKMNQEFQIQFLKKHGLQSDNKLLDIGCGTLRGGIPIIYFLDQGIYFGIDVRPEVIKEGRKELSSHQLEQKEPTIITFDQFQELKFGFNFDYMFA